MTAFLLIGLGNPGKEYAHNRHNIGFMVVDAFAQEYGATAWTKKFQGQIAEATVDGKKVLLLKPQTYMNLSGNSVAEAMRFYKIPPDSICVIHDELDFDFGMVKLKKSGGVAGHNGLKSIEAHIGNDFLRLRYGIGKDSGDISDYVLSDFSKEEMKTVHQRMPIVVKNIFPMIKEMQDKGAKNLKMVFTDTPPKASVSANVVKLDSRLRGNDGE